MNFIQDSIDRGLTSVMITNRGVKGEFDVHPFKVYHYKNVDTVEKYNEIVNSPLHADHPWGISIGMGPAN